MIDLRDLYNEEISELSLDGEYEIPKEKIDSKDIIELSKVNIKNSKIKKLDEDYSIQMSISGKMKIKDSVTLEDVWYPFNIDLDEKLAEFLENDKKSLDIIEFLWQNIVLEVPLRYTVVSDYSKYQGDGWKLVSEEKLVTNNPFNTLLKDEDRSD